MQVLLFSVIIRPSIQQQYRTALPLSLTPQFNIHYSTQAQQYSTVVQQTER